MAHTIKLKRLELIEQVKKNKEAHIIDYQEAVVLYRKEAERQLKTQAKELKNGSLKIQLKLVTPVNKSEEYDKIISMLEWETRDEIELNQNEFNEYVLDESNFAVTAKFQNSTYRG